MKKIFTLFFSLTLLLALVACKSARDSAGKKIPDVLGVDYSSAVTILEAEGFEVTSIETDASTMPAWPHCPMGKVIKGTVFRVEDYIRDGSGHLLQNYKYDSGDMVSDKTSLVIYYAKEDYTFQGEETPTASLKEDVATVPTTVEIPTGSIVTESTSEVTTTESVSSEELREEFKAAMDSYENFMDEYVAFMKKYSENPTDLTLLSEYASYLSKYSEFVDNFSKWENEDMNAAEMEYYIEVQSRVTAKLLEVSGS